MKGLAFAIFMMVFFVETAVAQVDIVAYGAVGDGKKDNSPALQKAIAAAKSTGDDVYVPAGIFAYSDVIALDGVKLSGEGGASVLYAQNWRREAIFLYGSGAGVSNITLSGVTAPARQSDWEMTRITIFGASDFVIDRVTIEGSAAAGIQTAKAARGGRITNNTIKNTKSDSIHITDKSAFIKIENNRIENSGDDGIAVVSYKADGGMSHDIEARNNVILNNLWGRQMSVVGGKDILYENNDLADNQSGFACLYIAQEKGYDTYAAERVTARNNSLKNCGGESTGHAAVMIYSDGEDHNTDIALRRNDIKQNGQSGIRVFSQNNTRITLDRNRIQGAEPDYDITSADVDLIRYDNGPAGYDAGRADAREP